MLLDDVAVDIDLHQIGGPHVLEVDPVFVDQEMMVRPREAGAEVGVDEVGPAMIRHEAIQRGEVAADLPLGFGNAGDRRRGGRDVH